MVAKAMRQD